jgi:molybdopterin/thiamine biosynthesis adenylyltransferase
MDEYDLIIDGSDNPLCRYLVNDYLMSTNKKYLSGACVAW